MSLCDSQLLLWRLITAPEGVAKALEEDPSDAALLAASVASRAPGSHSAELGPEQRLGVYADAYFARIHDVLQSDFSDLAARLGPDTFHDLVTSYLAIYPPERPSLRDVGERLPDFLRKGAGGELFRRRAPWAADLARLEWAQADLFDAPDATVATRQDFERLPAEAWADAELRLVPAAAFLSLDWPVHLLCASWPDARPSTQPLDRYRFLPARTEMLVWRAAETVAYRPLDAAEADALSHVAAGASFGALCDAAAQRFGDGDAPAQSASWLARWLRDGVLAAATSPDP